MDTDLQTSTGGRRLTRACAIGAFAGLYAFVFLPLMVVPVFIALGVVVGLAAPSIRRAVLRRRDAPEPRSGSWAPPG